MEKEEIIDCPKSGGNLCYKIEITPEIFNYMSLSCGFWTNSFMKEDQEFYMQQMETLPELYKDLAWTDPETELIWLPNTINVEDKGMIFANGPSAQNWKWAAVKSIAVTEEEKHKYPIPKKPGEFYEHRMDMTTMKTFDERDFIEALSYIGLLPE
jgi:hypothetical protein